MAELFEHAVTNNKAVSVTEMLKPERLLFFLRYQLGDHSKTSKQTTRLRQIDPAHGAQYTIWNVVSMYHQVLRDNAAPAMFLSLCEKMLAKLLEEGSLKTGEDLSLYCSILQRAGKIDAARALAEGPMGKQLNLAILVSLKPTTIRTHRVSV
jgi:hypothetical protein